LDILIVSEASENNGLGHIIREKFLALTLKKYGYNSIFAISNEFTSKILIEDNFEFLYLKDDSEIINELKISNYSSIIIDRKENPKPNFIKKIGKYSPDSIIVSIDDNGPARIFSDLVIDPTIDEKNNKTMDTSNNTTYCVGPKYTMVNPNFANFNRKIKKFNDLKTITLCFGGTDPNNITCVVLELLKNFENMIFNVVITDKFKFIKHLEKISKKVKSTVNIHISPKNLAELFFKSDIGIISFGTLFYEFSTVGTPIILVNPTNYHTKTADRMLDIFGRNLAINLGDFNKITYSSLKTEIERLKDKNMRKNMSKNQKNTFDGLGIKRIAEKIDSLIKMRR
jgi:spore coat polysaccharide biosynthesis predicted glycosyltransferase SpsG